MPISRSFDRRSIIAVFASAALLGVGAVPAAQAAPKVKPGTTTDTVTDTTTETTTETTTSGGTKDTRTSGGGRKIG